MVDRILRITSVGSSSWIEFRSLRLHAGVVYFDLAAQFENFTGAVGASTYYVGSPAIPFLRASKISGSFKSESWASLEGEIKISISGDSLGHRAVNVEMRTDFTRLEGGIGVEAGRLGAIAHDLAALFANALSSPEEG